MKKTYTKIDGTTREYDDAKLEDCIAFWNSLVNDEFQQRGWHSDEVVLTVNNAGYIIPVSSGYNPALGKHSIRTRNALALKGFAECFDHSDDLDAQYFCREYADYLEDFKRANINYSSTSYGMKHDAERWFGCYISNNRLIATVISEGFKFANHDRTGVPGPNYCFNVSIAAQR